MIYPEKLLPKNTFKIITVEDIDKRVSLLRKSVLPKEEAFDKIGDIRANAICEVKHVFGLSMNLYSIYDHSHIAIIINDKKLHDYWYPHESIPKSDDIDFEINDSTFPIFLPLNKLHRKPFPYSKNNPKNGLEVLEGFLLIDHKPTKCNFWHFELSVFDSNSSKILRNKPAWREKIASFLLKSYLKEYVLDYTPEKIFLDKQIYTS